MKPKLIILSDLWGVEKSPWLRQYTEVLKSDFELTSYDSCAHAEIKAGNLNENERHKRFVNGGMEIAVANLVKLEQAKVDILAFSIGGTIAWKAGTSGLNIKAIYAISSTRLRLETEKPDCRIHLIFGEEDPFKPDSNWSEKQKVDLEIIKNGNHEMYKNKEVIDVVCKRIKERCA